MYKWKKKDSTNFSVNLFKFDEGLIDFSRLKNLLLEKWELILLDGPSLDVTGEKEIVVRIDTHFMNIKLKN